MKYLIIIGFSLILLFGCITTKPEKTTEYQITIYNKTEAIKNNSQIKQETTSNWWEQYTSKISTKNLGFVFKLVKGCSTYECKILKIYDYVNSLPYIKENKEIIKSPNQTIKEGGDCEDKAILLSSLILKINGHPILVFSKDHVYTLICGVDLEKLKEEIKINKNKTMNLKNNKTIHEKIGEYEALTIKYNTTGYMQVGQLQISAIKSKINYTLKSNNPIKMYILKTQKDVEKLVYKKEINNPIYQTSYSTNTKGCFNITDGYIVIINNNNEDANVNLTMDINYYLKFKFVRELTYYEINKTKCVVVDPSMENGFPGCENEYTGGFAIDLNNNKTISLK